MSITHNKNLNPLWNLLITFISASSAPQILSIKGDCIFLSLNFLIIDLCNFSANYWSDITSFSAPLPEVFLSKNLWIIKIRTLWYPSYVGFLAILNALSCNILSAVFLLAKSLSLHKPCHVENKLENLVQFDKYVLNLLFLFYYNYYYYYYYYYYYFQMVHKQCISGIIFFPANKNLLAI